MPAIVLGLLAALNGCSLLPSSLLQSGPNSHDLLDRFPTPIYSIDGEPLNGGQLGNPKCTEAQSDWLARQDKNHDGTLDLDEVLAAARTRFTAMDATGEGYLTSDKLTAYRQKVMGGEFTTGDKLTPLPDSVDQADPVISGSGANRGQSDRVPKPTRLNTRPQGTQPDPVLAADANLDFKVTLDEFLTYQRELFARLDIDHDHTLSADELGTLCRIRERAAQPGER